MRNLFIVGLKLHGILCLYWAAGEIAQIGIAITSAPTLRKMDIQPLWHIFSIVIYVLVQFLFGLVLLVRSDSIADLLRVPDTAAAPGQITPAVLLYTLLIAVSIFILIQSIPQVLRVLVQWMDLRQSGRYPGTYQIGGFVAAISQTLLALIVIFRMRAMARQLLPSLKDSMEKMPGQ